MRWPEEYADKVTETVARPPRSEEAVALYSDNRTRIAALAMEEIMETTWPNTTHSSEE